jgi:NADH dehydrogenase/NADH:ubiquinone oxidoreductase subunit G
MEIEVGIGEIVDKLSILMIKKEKITDPNKLKNIMKEFIYLDEIVQKLKISDDDISDFLSVNKKLWQVEDDIREKERNKIFDKEFIELAREVYITNDLRAEIKRKINEKYSSDFIEEKSYSKY